jgi:hypothetical protein
MIVARRLILVVALIALSAAPAHAYIYRTARGLYEDCASGGELGETSTQKYRRCADYIGRIFNNWNLNQDNGVCSRHVGDELPPAYVAYWRAKRQGFLSGAFTSAETSVNEFLDSQRQPCPVPDPKTHPP